MNWSRSMLFDDGQPVGSTRVFKHRYLPLSFRGIEYMILLYEGCYVSCEYSLTDFFFTIFAYRLIINTCNNVGLPKLIRRRCCLRVRQFDSNRSTRTQQMFSIGLHTSFLWHVTQRILFNDAKHGSDDKRQKCATPGLAWWSPIQVRRTASSC